jgi:hypothetical protein
MFPREDGKRGSARARRRKMVFLVRQVVINPHLSTLASSLGGKPDVKDHLPSLAYRAQLLPIQGELNTSGVSQAERESLLCCPL